MSAAFAVTLPHGLVRDGSRRTAVLLRPPTGADEAFLLERRGWTRAELVTELLARCVLDVDGETVGRDEVRALTVGDREALLLHLRAAAHGERISCTVDCGACGERMDLDVSVADALVPAYADAPALHETRVGECTVQLPAANGRRPGGGRSGRGSRRGRAAPRRALRRRRAAARAACPGRRAGAGRRGAARGDGRARPAGRDARRAPLPGVRRAARGASRRGHRPAGGARGLERAAHPRGARAGAALPLERARHPRSSSCPADAATSSSSPRVKGRSRERLRDATRRPWDGARRRGAARAAGRAACRPGRAAAGARRRCGATRPAPPASRRPEQPPERERAVERESATAPRRQPRRAARPLQSADAAPPAAACAAAELLGSAPPSARTGFAAPERVRTRSGARPADGAAGA